MQLIKKEAERYAHSHLKSWKNLYITVKGHTLIANAGIDESNANGYYILWPRRPSTLAKEIRGFYGMEPLYDYRGVPDIFGRLLQHTTKNIVDGLSSMAVLLMGEGSERTPIMLLRGAKFVVFTDKDTYRQSVVDPKNDLYSPLWKEFK